MSGRYVVMTPRSAPAAHEADVVCLWDVLNEFTLQSIGEVRQMRSGAFQAVAALGGAWGMFSTPSRARDALAAFADDGGNPAAEEDRR